MTRAEYLAAFNRTDPQRARASEMAAARNRETSPRLGKYTVTNDIIEAMAAMRQRGKSWGQIGMRFGLSSAGARHRIERRIRRDAA